MMIEVVKSKIHRVKVTGADLDYIGSITIDEDLMDAVNLVRGEKVGSGAAGADQQRGNEQHPSQSRSGPCHRDPLSERSTVSA